MRTRAKICGITRIEDIHSAVHAGVDAIGFVFYAPSPRYVTFAQAQQLAHHIPAYVQLVGLFVNASSDEILQVLKNVPLDIVQFHGDESPEQCWTASDFGRIPYLRAARIPLGPNARAFDLVEYASRYSQAQAILLDAHVEGYGGGGHAFNWSLLPPNVAAHLVLSGGLTPANVTDGVRLLRPRCRSLAVDVSSGVEASAPNGSPLKGIKDAAKMKQFIAAVRAADVPL